jgi:uncharacterized protein with HEPN domain
MTRSDDIYVNGILESIKLILQYTDGKSEAEFALDVMLQDAVIRRFQIIGEASGKISETFKVNHANIKWGLMKAMRNKLIHEYFGISAHTIYQTIQNDLPMLNAQLSNATYS